MSIRVYSTLTRQKEDFQTVEPGKVKMYLCGPTVYKPAHIGHMVGPVIFDTVKRYLTYLGYQVSEDSVSRTSGPSTDFVRNHPLSSGIRVPLRAGQAVSPAILFDVVPVLDPEFSNSSRPLTVIPGGVKQFFASDSPAHV